MSELEILYKVFLFLPLLIMFAEGLDAEAFFYMLLFSFILQCDSSYIIGFYGAFFVENRISLCTEFMDGELCPFSTFNC